MTPAEVLAVALPDHGRVCHQCGETYLTAPHVAIRPAHDRICRRQPKPHTND